MEVTKPIDMDDLEAALLLMGPSTEIYRTVKSSLKQLGYWRNRPRGVSAEYGTISCALAGVRRSQL